MAKQMPVMYINWLASCGVASISSLLLSRSKASNSDVSRKKKLFKIAFLETVVFVEPNSTS